MYIRALIHSRTRTPIIKNDIAHLRFCGNEESRESPPRQNVYKPDQKNVYKPEQTKRIQTRSEKRIQTRADKTYTNQSRQNVHKPEQKNVHLNDSYAVTSSPISRH